MKNILFFLLISTMFQAESFASEVENPYSVEVLEKEGSALEDDWNAAKKDFKNRYEDVINRINEAIKQRDEQLDGGDKELRERTTKERKALERERNRLKRRLAEISAAKTVDFVKMKENIGEKIQAMRE